MLLGVVRWSQVLLLILVETHWDHPSLKGLPAGLLDRQDILKRENVLRPSSFWLEGTDARVREYFLVGHIHHQAATRMRLQGGLDTFLGTPE